MSPEQLVADLSANQQAILNTTGTTCTIVRPPGGNFDYENIVAGQDYITCAVGWDIDTRDWSRPGAQAIVDTTLAEAYSGAIVLMHDGGGDRSQTVEALSIILPELQAQGYQFVTIDELLELQRQEYIANGTITA
jgi:peptidoglycan/xylan/chitin deacetylase (PgdA/CDA1 family)